MSVFSFSLPVIRLQYIAVSFDVFCNTVGAVVCAVMRASLCQMSFEYLDFGGTDALDKFYNADVAVVDMSIHVQQASLFYHIGVRESMGMPETIILLNDTDPEFTLSVKVSSFCV